ncbi:MAG: hypothetical protein Q9161_001056 [Pseudevernia consocians]
MHRHPDNQVAGISMIAKIPNEKGSGAVENNDRNHMPPFSIGNDRIMALQPSELINSEELHVGGDYVQALSIAVPSRLRDVMATAKPLAGLRVAVKDNLQIKGIRTSLCNWAYQELYPPATKTAGCIEILPQSGTRIVGNTKLTSFTAIEEPIECVDFQAPWNPRADGYQPPAGSSSGIFASDYWLDIAIGSYMEVDDGRLI